MDRRGGLSDELVDQQGLLTLRNTVKVARDKARKALTPDTDGVG